MIERLPLIVSSSNLSKVCRPACVLTTQCRLELRSCAAIMLCAGRRAGRSGFRVRVESLKTIQMCTICYGQGAAPLSKLYQRAYTDYTCARPCSCVRLPSLRRAPWVIQISVSTSRDIGHFLKTRSQPERRGQSGRHSPTYEGCHYRCLRVV